MESSSVLPQELLDKVVDRLSKDHESLKSCALSSRSLLPRSQSHLFSCIHINLSLTSRLHAVLMDNPELATDIRELEVSYSFQDAHHSDLPHILRLVTSLRSLSISIRGGYWTNLPQNLRDTLFHAFGLPTLTNLNIDGLAAIPARFFAIRKSLKSLRLHSVSFVDVDPLLLLREYSQMTSQSLDLNHWNASDFLSEDIATIVLQSCALFAHIQILTVHNISRTLSLALPIMRSSLDNLTIVELRDVVTRIRSDQSWFKFPFDAMSNLRILKFNIAILSDLPQYFHPKGIATLRKLRNFVLDNPSVARIEAFEFSLTAHPAIRGSSVGSWATIPELLSNSIHWTELDQALDTRRSSKSAGCCLLNLPLRNRSEVSAAQKTLSRTICRGHMKGGLFSVR